jgi:hypothetical protein
VEKIHNEEFNVLYSPSIVWEIKSRRMRWAVHVALMGERRGKYRVLVGKPERTNAKSIELAMRPLGRARHSWRIILRWILRKWIVGLWSGSSWLNIGTGGRHL